MIQYLYCSRCNKCVSTPFTPVPTDTPDKGIIIRAWIECPECIEAVALGEPRVKTRTLFTAGGSEADINQVLEKAKGIR